MKKIILGALMMVFAISASAQLVTSTRVVEYKQPHNFTWGPKIGVDLTHFWGESVDHGVVFGYQAGLFAEYRATDLFGIAPEVVFAAQGGKSPMNIAHMNYINVPVMLKIYVAPAFSIDFGPQVGFNVYSKYTPKGGGAAVDMSSYTNTVDFGAGLGATYNIASDVFVQARYTMSFTEAMKHHKEKHGNAQIAIGYRF